MSLRIEFSDIRATLREIFQRLVDLERRDEHPFRFDGTNLYFIQPDGTERLVCLDVCCPCDDPVPDPIPGGGDADFSETLFGAFGRSFFPQTALAFWTALPNSTVPGRDDLIIAALGINQTVTIPATSGKIPVYENLVNGAGQSSLWYRIMPNGVSRSDPFTVTFPAENEWGAVFHWEFSAVSAVTEVSGTTLNSATLPTVNSPGPGWVVLYVVATDPLDGVGGIPTGALNIPGSSRTVDGALTTVDSMGWRPEISAAGDYMLAYEVTDVTTGGAGTGVGQTTPRSFSMVGVNNWAATTFLLDTRP
jgi:hypothetical protein